MKVVQAVRPLLILKVTYSIPGQDAARPTDFFIAFLIYFLNIMKVAKLKVNYSMKAECS
jgi:hypothetical protein